MNIAFISSKDNPEEQRHLFCPRHLSTGPVCGRIGVTTGFSESTPLCPDCEEATVSGCPYCGLPDEFHRTPLDKLVRRRG